MTLQLRRKRPTTPLNILQRDEGSGVRERGWSRVEGRGPDGWSRLRARWFSFFNLQFAICNLHSCVAALLTTSLVLSSAAVRAEVTRLQWTGDKSVKKLSDSGSSSSSSSALKFVKPKISGRQRDASIQLAAYEYEGSAPRLVSGRDSAGESDKSVVVNRDGDTSPDGFRAAQAAPITGTTKDPSGAGNAGVEDGLRSPFTDNAEPPQPNPLPIPEGNTTPTNPSTNNNPAGSQSDNPQQLNQRQQPPAGEANTGQFQPVLPSGPAEPEQSPTPVTGPAQATIQAEGEKAKESCDKTLQNLKAYTVDKVKLDIAIRGTEGEDYPFECSIDDGSLHAGRCWDQTTYMWKASALCHKPLYFENEQLERYGHSFSPCIQPFVSGAHFFTRLPVLPYCMGVEPPCECIYTLGHYRPGNCAPYMCDPIPLSLRGALFEAGAVTGVSAILP